MNNVTSYTNAVYALDSQSVLFLKEPSLSQLVIFQKALPQVLTLDTLVTFDLLVTEAIRSELSHGHMFGPFVTPLLTPFHCSSLGAVPKKNGTFCIILDSWLFYRWWYFKGGFFCSLHPFDDAVTMVRSTGTNAFLAKLDICHAFFRPCPVRPDQWCLLGYFWQGLYFMDTWLPFCS